MILIRFPNEDAKDRALELLLGEYRFKSWKSGGVLLPEEALPLLARENVPFTFEGIEGYERISAVRDPFIAAALKAAKPRPHWPKNYARNLDHYLYGVPQES